MPARISSFDWSTTSLGPADAWSPALRAMVGILLANRFPMLLWWGPEYISIYNDAYRPILGRKHPSALGQPVRKVWSEIWHILQPLIDTPYYGGPPTWSDDIELQINRSGFTEETHFTIAYSPVPDETVEGGIGGVLATVHEITEKVVGQRRVSLLRDLGARASDSETAEEACSVAAATLGLHPKDIPFALLYLCEPGKHPHLAASSGVPPDSDMLCETIALDDPNASWPLGLAQSSNRLIEVDCLRNRFEKIPDGPWSDPPQSAAIVPMHSGAGHTPGYLVAGISSRLALDEAYKDFLELATSQIATTVANAQAYEHERLRAEALAELDRAKTAFFSNVSHEFRTPLTLMLGPIEELLNQDASLSTTQRERLTMAHRNSLRLLRLVNSLLDFSRIEAGRMSASFDPVDLAALTANLASNFRSVMEAANLELRVDCEPMPEPVFVDRSLWEKIVFNLLSNAFKFTLEGSVTVRVAAENGRAVLSISDTGTGIPESELPRIFERFHRVEGASGRTYEGSGIGLALIQELVKLHGGAINVESRMGHGSVFRVSIPLGSAHLPKEQVRTQLASNAQPAEAFVGEAATWLAPADSSSSVQAPSSTRQRILLADDNADMRSYVSQILGGDYEVIAVSSGEHALRAAREQRPHLILTDVMMPGLDGFGLMNALRSDPSLRDVPIVLISARAGEEARIEGISQGADDYITKPFNANELLSRVRTTLNLQSMRRAAEDDRIFRATQFETLINQAPLGVYIVGADFRIRQVNPIADRAFDTPNLIGRDFNEVLHLLAPKDYADDTIQIFRRTLDTGVSFIAPERMAQRFKNNGSKYFEWRVDRIMLADGQFGLVCYFHDISALVLARKAIAASEERLTLAVEGAGMGTWDVDLASGGSVWSARHFAMLGYSPTPDANPGLDMWRARLHPDDVAQVEQRIQEALSNGGRYISEHRILRADTGELRWLSEFGRVVRNQAGEPVRFVGISFDNTARNRAEQEQARTAERLRRANTDLEQFAYSASHDLQEPLRGVRVYSELLALRLQGKLSESERECLGQVCDSAERMEILLRDLSSYIEAWGIERDVTQFADAEACLTAALSNLGAVLKNTGTQIDHDPLPSLRVEPTRLQQIFQNIIGNSIKYRRPDAAPQIRIRAEREGNMWRFAVRDNGIGISQEFHTQIFGLFKRLHSRQRYPGSGIGLALCARIMEQYRGRIWVESSPGDGATFYFTLPA